MNSNADNPIIGRNFQKTVLEWARDYYETDFLEESVVNIGNPPRPHKFDIVSKDSKIIIECKCYTWTTGGNVPSAKLSILDEAVLYLRCTPISTKKIIAMKFDWNEKKQKSLAEYFCDKKNHLLDDVMVVEIDDAGGFRFIRE